MYKMPGSALSASAFLPLGPMGLGGFALLNLSSVMRSLARAGEMPLGGASLYTLEEAVMMANAVYAISIPLALLFWGGGLVWLTLAIMTYCDMVYIERGFSKYNLGYWGLVFPLGVFSISTLTLGKELDSGFFRVLGTVLTGFVTSLWLLLTIVTAIKATTGELFFSPCLAEIGGEPPKQAPTATRRYPYTPRARSTSRPAAGSSGFGVLFPRRYFSRPPPAVRNARGRSPGNEASRAR